jgi:hypothetical protein
LEKATPLALKGSLSLQNTLPKLPLTGTKHVFPAFGRRRKQVQVDFPDFLRLVQGGAQIRTPFKAWLKTYSFVQVKKRMIMRACHGELASTHE